MLEITEAMLMEDIHNSTRVLKSIDSLGVQISINNFGAYSSLSHLPGLPLDIIKIDWSFIGNLSSSKFNETMAEAIISLAHILDVKVIAEGIETEQQADFLRQKKSEGGQGFYFGQPMPPENLLDILKGNLSRKKSLLVDNVFMVSQIKRIFARYPYICTWQGSRKKSNCPRTA